MAAEVGMVGEALNGIPYHEVFQRRFNDRLRYSMS